jgi:hypothetical protein
MSEEINELRRKVEELERNIGGSQQNRGLLAASKSARKSGELRAKALQLPETQKSLDLAESIAGLAERSNVVVEWTARELSSSSLAAVRCCCCCCCCIVIASW